MASSLIGAPILFILNGHKAVSTSTEAWDAWAKANNDLVVYMPISMPAHEVLNDPKGVWEDPPSAIPPHRVWILRRLRHILDIWSNKVETDATCEHILSIWEKANKA